jgi:tetratricopeptide (TPR) repeat protein
MTQKIMLSVTMLALLSCGADEPSYQVLIDDGWSLFQSGQYTEAIAVFTEARDLAPERADAYAGMGWSRMKLDDLPGAGADFATGAPLVGTRVHLLGGYTFTLHALKDYANSNVRADELLTLLSDWVFPYANGIDATDIHIVKAENFFALGEFASSLATVKTLNPSFPLNAVSTPADEMALAAEIERLKGIN